MPAFSELVLVGRVVRPQGRRGEVKVEPFSDRSDRFPALARVFAASPGAEPRELDVTGCFAHKGHFVLKLAGVDSIDAAERLRDAELRIPETELARLPAGSYYYHQLQGLAAVDEQGAPLGEVQEVMETGAPTRVLVLRGAQGETLVPFASEFVRAVDLDGRRIVLARPEYVVAD